MNRPVDVVAGGFSFLTGPRWRDGRLWVSDLHAGRVLAVGADGRSEEILKVPAGPAGLGWLPNGRLLVVSSGERRVLRRERSGEVVTHADLSPLGLAGHPYELLVGPTGRSYVGDVVTDPDAGPRTTRLFCIQPDGRATVVADDLRMPRGMTLFPDYTLVVAESRGSRLTAFRKGTDGALEGRREWADLAVPRGDVAASSPAGICADIDGNLWVADQEGNRVLRVRDGGEILEEIPTGDLSVNACMLAGDDGRTLFCCAAPPGAFHSPGDAVLLSVRVDVPHGGLP